MSEQPSRLTVKVRLEPKPLHELPESAAVGPAPFSLWRLGLAAILLLLLAAAISWVWWQYRPDPQLTAATQTPADAAVPAATQPARPAAKQVVSVAETAATDKLTQSEPPASRSGADDAVARAQQVRTVAPAADQLASRQQMAPHSPAERTAAPYPAGFSRIVLTAHMRNLEPGRTVGELVPYPAVKRLYLFTELKGYAGQVIQHRWYYQNELKTTATLTIEDSPWRTYSENWLLDDQQGDWRVEIVDQRQQVLYQYSFSYR